MEASNTKDLITSTPDSKLCRICHERTPIRGLIAPCKCHGSITFVHKKCLNRWLTTSQSNQCELCGASYTLVQEPRSFAEFCRVNPRSMVIDIILVFLLTPLPLVATYLCFKEANNWKQNIEMSFGLIALVAILYVVYFAWFVLTFRRHVINYFEWSSANPHLRIVWPHRSADETKNESSISLEEDVFAAVTDVSRLTSTQSQPEEIRIRLRSIHSPFII